MMPTCQCDDRLRISEATLRIPDEALARAIGSTIVHRLRRAALDGNRYRSVLVTIETPEEMENGRRL